MKKNIIKASAMLLFLFAFVYAAYTGNSSTVDIKTSAKCNDCKVKIEKAVNDLKGVEKADLNLDTKVVTVEYNTTEVNPDKIRHAIADAGFDADDVKATKAGCCTGHKVEKSSAKGCCKHGAMNGCKKNK